MLKNWRRYEAWQAFHLSFFSRDFYRDAGQNWKGSGLGYFFVLWALCSLVTTYQLGEQVKKFLALEQAGQLKNLPSIMIKSGIVTTSARSVVYLPNQTAPYLIVDTTGQVTDLKKSGATLLLTRDHLLFKQTGLQTRTISLAAVDDLEINSAVLKDWAGILKQGWVWAVYPLQVVGGFLFEVFALLVYGIIGLVMASLLKVQLGFNDSRRLAALSHTPVFILFTCFGLIFSTLSAYYMVAFVLNCCFLYFAVESNLPDVVGGGSSMITET